MACIDMFNPDHQSLCGGGGSAPPAQPMSPRISFSSDFLMEVPAVRAPGPPPDPNFEFLVGSRPMITADQLFFKGRLLPLKENCASGSSRGVTTLRDELRGKDESGGGRERPPKASSKWKEFLGLKKSRSSAAKKIDKNENATAAAAEDAHAHLDKSMQGGKELKIYTN